MLLTLVAYVTFTPGLPDQGYDDSDDDDDDDSSVFSTPSPKTRQRGATPPLHLSLSETQHASLKRKKLPEKPEPMNIHRTPLLEKSQSLQAEIAPQRPLSMVIGSQSEANVIVNPATGSLQRQVGQQVRR